MSFAALEFLAAVRQHVCVITRLRLDANLFAPAPPRPAGTSAAQRGAPAQARGAPAAGRTPWRRVTVPDWYGDGERVVEVVSGTAIWFHTGRPAVPIRWVLIRDPAAKFEPQALLCTDLDLEPGPILTWFVQRWRLEVTFAESRRHLGVETQRQWSEPATARTTPALFGLFSLVTVWANDLLIQTAGAPRQASWDAKSRFTFSDAIAAVRYHLWQAESFATSPAGSDVIKVSRALFERLTDTLCYAA